MHPIPLTQYFGSPLLAHAFGKLRFLEHASSFDVCRIFFFCVRLRRNLLAARIFRLRRNLLAVPRQEVSGEYQNVWHCENLPAPLSDDSWCLLVGEEDVSSLQTLRGWSHTPYSSPAPCLPCTLPFSEAS